MSLPVETLRKSERLKLKAQDRDKVEAEQQPMTSTAKFTSKGNENEDKATTVPRSKTSKSSSQCKGDLLRLEIEMKKKELEFRHQQEMMDLQLELQLAQIKVNEEESGEESVSIGSELEGHHPNIESWKNGKNPWVHDMEFSDDKNKKSDKVGSNHLLINEQIASYQLNKILTRQSIPQDLPTFNGDPMEWPNFIFNYRNTTAICGYSPEENLCRLQKCLKGHARKIVECLLILPSNVDKIVQLLEQRFGRPEQIIMLLLNKIRNFPFVKSDRLDLLINFSDEVKSYHKTNNDLHSRNPARHNKN